MLFSRNVVNVSVCIPVQMSSDVQTGVSVNLNAQTGATVNAPVLTGNTFTSVTFNYSTAGHEPQKLSETAEKHTEKQGLISRIQNFFHNFHCINHS
ncbi:hypothetical protein G5714_024514 [Onychostoma macrolepis]|uniref:Uncharacterized protein n=1 Tax=Onychostoma macrolepis TaxID=369639 RepID=A0A7J6BKG5_9TELE|nr:hypothetical protein G5714_024514 [Onychostoma macrolepis]